MKEKLYFLILFFSIKNCFGQADTLENNSKKIIFGTSTGTQISLVREGLFFYPFFTIGRGKSFFAIGPAFGPKINLDVSTEDRINNKQYSIKGVQFNYQFYPNPNHKIFDSFFQYQFSYLHHIDNGIDINVSPQQTFYSNRTDIESYFCYGVKEKVFNFFYLTQSVGLGLVRQKTIQNYPALFYLEDNTWAPNFMIHLEFGYRFNRK